MKDNIIQFPQKSKEKQPEPCRTWSFEMEDHTGSIFSITYDLDHRDLEMVKVSDGYIEHLCETLCDSVRKNPELEEYVTSTLERIIRQIIG